MILAEIRLHEGIVMFGYTYGTEIRYWSMRYYRAADVSGMILTNPILVQMSQSHRFI